MTEIKAIPVNIDPVEFHKDQVTACARRLVAFWQINQEGVDQLDLTEDFLHLEEALRMLEEAITTERLTPKPKVPVPPPPSGCAFCSIASSTEKKGEKP